jgi:hypothetical protein
MSCNNTNSTCSNCSNNYSSCNNKCNKCGCKDSFLTSPPPCPTPAGCPDPIPCQEVLSSDCIIYNGPDLLCNGDIIVYQDATWTELLENIIEYFCLPPIPEITCNGDIVVDYDSSINEALEDIVSYFCLPPIPEILCGEDIVVTEDSSINDALEDIVSYFCDQLTTANNGLTMSPTSYNVQLGGPLIQDTTITNSTFNLNINSITVPALTLFKSTINNAPTLLINDPAVSTTAPAIQAYSNRYNISNPAVYFENLSSNIDGGLTLLIKSQNNTVNAISPQITTPTLYIQSSKTASTTTQVALRVDNTNNINAGSGIAIEFANSDATPGTGIITNRLISKTVNNSTENSMTSEFVIQGKQGGTVNPVDHLTLKSTGQLQLNNYGSGLNTGVPTYNLSTTVGGDIIETVAGSEVTLTSAGGIVSLVNDGTGPTLAINGLTAGTGITISPVPGALTISATLQKVLSGGLTGNQTITHNLATTDLVVSVVEAVVPPAISFVHGVDYTYVCNTLNSITITEVFPGGLGTYKVTILG